MLVWGLAHPCFYEPAVAQTAWGLGQELLAVQALHLEPASGWFAMQQVPESEEPLVERFEAQLADLVPLVAPGVGQNEVVSQAESV